MKIRFNDGREEEFVESKIFDELLEVFARVGETDFRRSTDYIDEVIHDARCFLEDEGFESVPLNILEDTVSDALLSRGFSHVAREWIRDVERKRLLSEKTIQRPENRLTVIKKNGRREPFDEGKIRKAIESASLNRKLPESVFTGVIEGVKQTLSHQTETTTEEIHNLVEKYLSIHDRDTFEQYAIYRRYKKQMAKSFDEARQNTERILFDGDNENANKNSSLNSTKQTLIAESLMRSLMTGYELSGNVLKAHEDGFIYVHDISSRYLRQHNCNLFDMGRLLKGGFLMNSVTYLEPSNITSAFAVVGDVVLQASAQQYGGFTVPELDKVLAPYAEKTYIRHKKYFEEKLGDTALVEEMAMEKTLDDIRRGVKGFETKLNTVSSSLGQVPFVTISFGLSTGFWSKNIAHALLDCRILGMGAEKSTAVFPKLVMLVKDGVNRSEGDPNYDIFRKAIECSSKRLYPDYLSLDGEGNNLAEIYERCGQAVSPMGCRAYLSPWFDGDREVYVGRGNLGAATLNLPKIALESHGDIDRFFELLDVYSAIIFDYHEDYMQKVGKQKGSSNPLFYCEGGAWKSVGYDEEIMPVIRAFTSPLGYIGLEETCEALGLGSIVDNEDFGLRVVSHLNDLCKKATAEKKMLFALYSTPAESLCYTFQKRLKKEYGDIPGVTDREYLTNSFHVPVWEPVNPLEKISLESPYHKIATGGRISYVELPFGTDVDVIERIVDFAMDNGMYFGVNVVSATCSECQFSGDFRDECPKCGNSNILVVSRVCGYLSFERQLGDKSSRFNPGKKAELLERIKHIEVREKTKNSIDLRDVR